MFAAFPRALLLPAHPRICCQQFGHLCCHTEHRMGLEGAFKGHPVNFSAASRDLTSVSFWVSESLSKRTFFRLKDRVVPPCTQVLARPCLQSRDPGSDGCSTSSLCLFLQSLTSAPEMALAHVLTCTPRGSRASHKPSGYVAQAGAPSMFFNKPEQPRLFGAGAGKCC